MTADPGWGPSVRPFWHLLIPGLAIRLGRKGRPPITELRAVFLSFAEALLLIASVLPLIIEEKEGSVVQPWMVGFFIVYSVSCFLGVLWGRSRPPRTEDAEALTGSYRTRLFLGISFAQSPALVAFVGSIIAGRAWPYFVGLSISALGLALIAPTSGDIERQQRLITAQGSTLSLVEALAQPPEKR